MQLDEIVTFWRGQQTADQKGHWVHRLDRETLNRGFHSFNLDHPVSPYVGDVINARVIILGANGGYSPELTPTEFPDHKAIADYVERVDNPAEAAWTFVSRYYDRTNYCDLVAGGQAALVNACAYRSPKLSQEPENKAIMKTLPSVIFARRWLLEAVLPMAEQGERLIVVKRGGQWKLPPSFPLSNGVVVDPAPISPQITSVPYAKMASFLGKA